MKNRLFKTILSIALAGVLAFSGIGSGWTGLHTVEAAKLVQPTTLAQVTGIQYDEEKSSITWNQVSGANSYNITLINSEGYYYKTSSSYPYARLSSFTGSWYHANKESKKYSNIKGIFTVRIVAIDSSRYYEVQKGEVYNYMKYDYSIQKNRYYKYLEGPAGNATINTEPAAIVKDSITSLPSIVQVEVQQNSILFKPVGISKLNQGEYIYWDYANNPEFRSNKTKGYYASRNNSTSDVNAKFRASTSSFSPGETMYVRARVYNSYYKEGNGYTYTDDKYGPYTKTVTYQVPKAKITSFDTYVDANSITISATTSGSATGYQFAKKVKSKWVTLGTQTSNTYTDKNLEKSTKYEYRVRSYYYNKFTKKTVWTQWRNIEAVTWGSNLNLKADAASTSSVKLTWKPVSGAEGYEIYRYDKPYKSNVTEKGQSSNYYSKGILVKTIKSGKAKTYTDKKLTKGQTYTYVVRAYKTINKQKCYVEDSSDITLQAGNISLISEYYNASGNKVITWHKMTGIKGYYVEKYDEATGQYALVKKLSQNAVSYTFPKVNPGSDSVKYQIRPYDETIVYGAKQITVSPSLAAVKNVKAVRSGNGIRISWSPVAGADGYRVYRTTSSNLEYDKTTKTYKAKGSNVYEAGINTTGCRPDLGDRGYNNAGTYSTYLIGGTSVLDATITYTKTAVDGYGKEIKIGETADGKTIYQTEEAIYYQGPEPGVTYYYYVVAYANAPNGSYNYSTITSTGCTKPASATYTNAIAKKVSKITSVSSKKKGQVTIKYKKVSKVSGYAIYRSTKKNGTYTMIGTSTKTTFTDYSAKSGKTYYYKVASYVKGEVQANIYSAKTSAKQVKVK